MSEKIFNLINDQIIGALEEGSIPWKKPWVHAGHGPMNANSLKTYSGINFFLLSLFPHSSPYWLTFNQIKQKKGHLKKGSKGAPVTFYKILEKKNSKTGEIEKVPLLRYYRVYNADQIENINFPKLDTPEYNENFKEIELAEKIFEICESRTCKIQHREQGSAFYLPLSHEIILPEKKQFPKPSDYYATAFHEIGHATGHQLGRDLTGIMGMKSHAYSKEELVAEMVSSYLCAFAGISPLVIEDSTAYIKGWLKTLKNDPKFVIQAASLAQKAVNLLLDGTEFFETESQLQEVA